MPLLSRPPIAMLGAACLLAMSLQVTAQDSPDGAPAEAANRAEDGAADTGAQAGADLAPLTFTARQAIGGGVHYNRVCAACHGSELEGGAAPGLGSASLSFTDRPVSELHDYVQDLMPADNPGSLSDAQVSTIIAYIAQKDGMEAGPEAIPTDPAELTGIRFGQ